MHRPAIVLLAAGLLAGCAATATQTWRSAPGTDAPAWTFTGEQGAWGATKIYINGELVLDGKVSVFSGDGRLEGTYQGRSIAASCENARTGNARTQCAITVDGRKATTLNFRVN